MAELRAIIVDDEALAREFLVSILEGVPGITIVDTCKNGREAIRSSQELQPDLLFLDIHMPGMSGFDTIRALQSDTMPMVIFATAYDQYAVDAFELHAVDYVLKPFEPERVKLAVERAIQRKNIAENAQTKASLIEAMDDASQVTRNDPPAPGLATSLSKLPIPNNGETILVPIEDIDWVDAAGDYMCIHVNDQTHILRCTMKELESRLQDSRLVRIHRSTLANLEKVVSISSLPKGECLLHMACDVTLKVSRSCSDRVKFLRH